MLGQCCSDSCIDSCIDITINTVWSSGGAALSSLRAGTRRLDETLRRLSCERLEAQDRANFLLLINTIAGAKVREDYLRSCNGSARKMLVQLRAEDLEADDDLSAHAQRECLNLANFLSELGFPATSRRRPTCRSPLTTRECATSRTTRRTTRKSNTSSGATSTSASSSSSSGWWWALREHG